MEQQLHARTAAEKARAAAEAERAAAAASGKVVAIRPTGAA
jgi:hypothetical protein